ncbi:MAG: class I poly(R)-hydroxyalkanoic acid synthase, partial [Methyloceanibacter sp.]
MPENNNDPGASQGEDTEPSQFETLSRNMVRLFDQGAKAASMLAGRSGTNGNGSYSVGAEVTEAAKSLGEVARHWVADPSKLAAAQGELFRSYANLWDRSVRRFLGEEVEPVVEPEPGDNRFKDPDWSNTQFFDFWKQAYLITSRWAEDLTRNTEGLDDKTRKKALFYLNQMMSALSPSNFPLTNPEVVRTTLQTNAENLVQGMAHFVHDLEQSKDLLRISQTDLSAFEIGRNLAVTQGKVVFQNDLIQLIQYAPATAEVYERPLLVVPPWINKYYILDLVPEKSFVKWAVEQGFTVF